jgi:predicted signal transduction protein with EAL and GGDEF domain
VAANEISIAIHTEQLRAVFRQLPISFVVNLINAALTAIVLSTIGPEQGPLGWFSVVALVTGVRWALWRQYRRFPLGPSRIELGRGSLSAGHCLPDHAGDLAEWCCSRLFRQPGRSF